MKWLLRTLIILAAALLVSGIAYVIVEADGNTAGQPSIQGQSESRPDHDAGERGDGRPEMRGSREGVNWYGIDQVFQPLVIIAAIVVIVAPIIGWLRNRTMLTRT